MMRQLGSGWMPLGLLTTGIPKETLLDKWLTERHTPGDR